MQPFDYLNTTVGLIWIIACVPLGFALTALGYLIMNRIPAKWLCDYDETPSEELLSGKRFKYLPSGIILSVIMSVCLMLCRVGFNKGYDIYFIAFALLLLTALMIAISDFKYQIIPDQFTIAVGVIGAAVSAYDIIRGFNILHSGWWSPLLGAAIGAATMLLIDFIGMKVYHREGMGFGDVKLFFAVGIFTGFPGTIYTFLISIITATVVFTVTIIISKMLGGKSEEPETDVSSDDTNEKQADSDDESKEQKENSSDTSDENKKSEEKETDNSENDKADDDNSEKTEDAEVSEENEEEKDVGFGSYLAFGPYIAMALCAYIALFDLIQYLTGLYLNLFH